MNRSLACLAAAVAAAALSIGLALLPNAFNPMDGGYNDRLRLTWFLGVALQGLAAAGAMAALLSRLLPKSAAIWSVWGVTAALGVAVPAPGMLSGSYADRLLGVYAVLVGVSFAGLVWNYWPITRRA